MNLKMLRIYIFICLIYTNSKCIRGVGNTSFTKLLDLCPYSNFCTVDARESLQRDDQMPCCQACSCADDCWRRGQCCADKEMLETKPPTETCVSTMVKRAKDDDSHYDGLTRNIQRYFVTDSCPTTESNLTVIQKCEGKAKTSFEEYTWVSDKETIFSNKFCAECNGHFDYTVWDLVSRCTKIVEKGVYFDGPDMIPEACSMMVLPKRAADVQSSMCFTPQITECNSTGQWTQYDLEIDNSCKAYNKIFFVETIFSVTIYKNIFCFLCNTKKGRIIQDVCSPTIYLGKTSGFFFQALLNWKLFEDARKAKLLDSRCGANEFEDTYMNVCRVLSCPVTKSPLYGRCEKQVYRILGLGITLSVKLLPIWSAAHAKMEIDYKHLGRQIHLRFQEELGLLQCSECHNYISVSRDLTAIPNTDAYLPLFFAVSSSFATNLKCDEDFILNQMMAMADKTIKVKISNEGYLSLKATIMDDKFIDELAIRTEVMYDKRIRCVTARVIRYHDISMCPSISLNPNDYKNFSRVNDVHKRSALMSLFSAERVKGRFVSNITSNVNVCLEDYKRVLANVENGVATSLTVRLAVTPGLLVRCFLTVIFLSEY